MLDKGKHLIGTAPWAQVVSQSIVCNVMQEPEQGGRKRMAEPKQIKRVICDIPISLLSDEEKLRRKRDFITAAGKPKKPKYPLTQSFSRIRQIELYKGKHSCDIRATVKSAAITARPKPTVYPPNSGTARRVAGRVKLKHNMPRAAHHQPAVAVFGVVVAEDAFTRGPPGPRPELLPARGHLPAHRSRRHRRSQ